MINKESTLEQRIIIKILTDKFIEYVSTLIPEDIEEIEQIKETIVIFKKYINRYIENLKNKNEIECSLLIESILEVTLKLFIYSYIKDKAYLKKWNINIDKLQQDISKYINSLGLEINQKNTLKELIKKELRTRKYGKRIYKMSLDELIDLYQSEELLKLAPKNDKDLDEFEPLTYNVTIRALLNLTPEEEIEIQKEYIKNEKVKRNKQRQQEKETIERIKNIKNNIHIPKKENQKTTDITEDYIGILYDLTCRLEHFFEDKREKHQKNLTK